MQVDGEKNEPPSFGKIRKLLSGNRLLPPSALVKAGINPASLARAVEDGVAVVYARGIGGGIDEMARGNPVVLATRSFPSQGPATDFFKEMLARYRSGDRISDVDALDLAALLERHDEFAQKVGSGTDHF